MNNQIRHQHPQLGLSISPSPPASFSAPALVPTNASNDGLTPKLTAACKDSDGVLSPAKRLRRWRCVERGKSGLMCVVGFRSTSVVMWDVRCGVKWEVCVGVSPSSASFLREWNDLKVHGTQSSQSSDNSQRLGGRPYSSTAAC